MAGWVTEGSKTAPASGTVLADSGPMPMGSRYFNGLISITGAGTILYQHRNADNTATIKEHSFSFLAADKLPLPEFRTDVDTDERIRIVTSGLLTLVSVQASLNWS